MNGYGNSRFMSIFKGNGKIQCSHYKEYGHIKNDYPKCDDKKKSDNLSIIFAKEYEKYIEDVFTVSKYMDSFSHDK